MQDTEYKVFDGCGNLIAPSMELGPSARERFEEAGYKYKYCENDENDDECIDYDNDEKNQSIVFRLRKKRYAVYGTKGVDMKTLELINYQCKELGWLR